MRSTKHSAPASDRPRAHLSAEGAAIHAAAARIVDRHGLGAPQFVADMVAAVTAMGDQEGQAHWRAIATLIETGREPRFATWE